MPLLLLASFSDDRAVLVVGGVVERRVRHWSSAILSALLLQLDRADDSLELSYETDEGIDADEDVAPDRHVLPPPEPLDDVHDLAELALLSVLSRCFLSSSTTRACAVFSFSSRADRADVIDVVVDIPPTPGPPRQFGEEAAIVSMFPSRRLPADQTNPPTCSVLCAVGHVRYNRSTQVSLVVCRRRGRGRGIRRDEPVRGSHPRVTKFITLYEAILVEDIYSGVGTYVGSAVTNIYYCIVNGP